MNQHECPRFFGDDWLNEGIVYLESIKTRLNEHRRETILGNSQNGCYEGVCRNDDLITLFQHSHFYIGAKDERECIESVGYADTMFCADIISKMPLETLRSLSLQIPAAIHDMTNGLVYLVGMHRRDSFQGEIINLHNVHS